MEVLLHSVETNLIRNKLGILSETLRGGPLKKPEVMYYTDGGMNKLFEVLLFMSYPQAGEA